MAASKILATRRVPPLRKAPRSSSIPTYQCMPLNRFKGGSCASLARGGRAGTVREPCGTARRLTQELCQGVKRLGSARTAPGGELGDVHAAVGALTVVDPALRLA
jgi:hypothetical protein